MRFALFPPRAAAVPDGRPLVLGPTDDSLQGGDRSMKTEEQIDTLNELLRGELAATETYQQAMAKVSSGPGSAELRQIHDEHRDAANTLRQHVHSHGGKPDQGSGAWGTFAKAIEGAAKVFGNTAALK